MWQLDGSKALLHTPQLACQLDLAMPANGLTELTATRDPKQPLPVDAALMQLSLPHDAAPLLDAYVRGRDLVATYGESAVHPCRTQVYWRFEQGADYFGVQLIVSVQTSRLDAIPALRLTSRLPSPVRSIERGVVVAPLPGSNLCYAELADQSNVESTTVHDTHITTSLFPGSLEKGVIRRARILGCFLDASAAEPTATALRARLSRSAPPLTT